MQFLKRPFKNEACPQKGCIKLGLPYEKYTAFQKPDWYSYRLSEKLYGFPTIP
jgi:hypothetical protein